MLLACLPINVLMRRRKPSHHWDVERWVAAAVMVPEPGVEEFSPAEKSLTRGPPDEVITRLDLELFFDENDAYFENWAAPEPKVFVMWQLREELAIPVLASVSYAEGARMLDSGEQADGLAMPEQIRSWLGAYLRIHYRPQVRGRGSRRA